MIIVGRRIHFSKNLADYLLARGKNDAVFIKEIENYPSPQLSNQNIKNALYMMGTQAMAKGTERPLYSAVIALPNGEVLNKEQLKFAVNTLAANLKLAGHQRIIVEHRKSGRQHFHIIFNILDPATGKVAQQPFSRHMHFQTAISLQRKFGLKPELCKGRSIHDWEYWRGKHSGIDPFQMRRVVTALYQSAQTGAEFVKRMAKAGYALSIGKFNTHVIIDRHGHIHGLMGRIEGAKLADLHAKFPDLKHITLPALAHVQTAQRAKAQSQRVTQPVRAGTQPIKRFSSASQIPQKPFSLLLPPRRTNRVAQLMAYGQLSAEREKARALKQAAIPLPGQKRSKRYENEAPKPNFNKAEIERAELIAWAFENGRVDILAQFGIHIEKDGLEVQ